MLHLLARLIVSAQDEWQESFSIPGLPPYGQLIVSERHQAILRTSPGGDQVIWQNFRTGETNRAIDLPAHAGGLAISPDHRWLYVSLVEPPATSGRPWTNIVEIDLTMPETQRTIGTPNRIVGMVAADNRLVVLNVYGTTEAAPYLLRVLNAESGQVGPTTAVSNYQLALGAEQDSVFAFNTVAPTMEDTFRHRFDTNDLSWLSKRRFPVIAGEAGAPNGLPFGYTPDRAMLLTQFGIYTNQPGDTSQDLRRRAPFFYYWPKAVFFHPTAPKFGFIGEQNRVSLLRTDRWEPAKAFFLSGVGSGGAVAYGRDGDEIMAVYIREGEADGRVARFRPPLELLATNAPPVARLAIAPNAPTTAEPALLDASASHDDVTPAQQLRFRWDLNGDAVFDTPFTNSPVLAHRFAREDAVTVKVEVEDELGERAQAEVSFEVAFAPRPAVPLNDPVPWQFSFQVRTAIFDLPRHRVFALDASSTRLIEISTTNGLAVREFFVDSVPAPPAMALSADGRHLYLAEVHAKPLVQTDYDNTYLVEFDLEANVRGREVYIGGFVTSILTLPDHHLAYSVAYSTGNRTEVRRWPDPEPIAFIGDGSFPATMLPAGSSNVIYSFSVNDATATLRRRVFDPDAGTLTGNAGLLVRAFPHAVVGNGRFLIFNTGAVRSLLPDAPSDFATVTNLVTAPPGPVTDFPAHGIIGLRGESHWEFVRTSDWSRLVIQPAKSFASPLAIAMAAGDEQRLYELRSPDANGGTTLDFRRLPAVDPEANQAPVVTMEAVPTIITLGQSPLITAYATDDDGAVTEFDLLVNGTPQPALPVGFPAVPGRKQWQWPAFDAGTYRLQIVAKDNLGAITTLPETALRVNHPPIVEFGPPFPDRRESPISFELTINADGMDDAITSLQASYTPAGGQRRSFGTLTSPPFRFQVEGLSGRDGGLTVTATDEGGATTSKTVTVQLDPPPGDSFAKPLVLEGERATTFFAARQMSLDAVQMADFPNQAIGPGFGGVWWRWTAPTNLAVQVDTFGSSFDTILRVITTNRPARIVDENADDPLMVPWSRVKFTAETGQVFLIGVFGQRATETGDIRLNLTSQPWEKPAPAAAPPNDLFTNRITLETGSQTDGTTQGARVESQEPGLRFRATNTVWYQWTAPASGWARVEAESEVIDPELSLFLSATTLNRLRLIESRDDTSLADAAVTWTFPVLGGSNYVFRVTGAGHSQGAFAISVNFPADPSAPEDSVHDRMAQARLLAGDLFEFEGHNRTATAEPDLVESLQLAEPVNGVWWRWTASTSGHAYWALRRLVGAPFSTLLRRVVTIRPDGSLLVMAPGPEAVAAEIAAGGPLKWKTEAGTTYFLFVGTPVGRATADFRFFLNNQVNPAPLDLLAPHWTDGGTLQLPAVSLFTRRAMLESSSDLRLWSPNRFVTLAQGTNQFELSDETNEVSRFYRLRSDD